LTGLYFGFLAKSMLELPISSKSKVTFDLPDDADEFDKDHHRPLKEARSTEHLAESKFLPLIRGKGIAQSMECLANIKALFKSYMSCPMTPKTAAQLNRKFHV
jgi:hypothetical protein